MSLSLDNFVRDMIPSQGELPETLTQRETPGDIPGHSLENLVASGGMGAVYLARQQTLGREVAVKVMVKHADKPQMADRFRREAWVLGRLEHPNIVPIHELGLDSEGRPFYSMNW
ncbi:MAG: protein kinase domain-containing protein [Prosthecobacter sp.]